MDTSDASRCFSFVYSKSVCCANDFIKRVIILFLWMCMCALNNSIDKMWWKSVLLCGEKVNFSPFLIMIVSVHELVLYYIVGFRYVYTSKW
jgi:hypothetical protein